MGGLEGGGRGGGGDYIYVTYNDTCTIQLHVKNTHKSVLTLQYLFYLHFINFTLLTYGAHYCKRPRQIMQKKLFIAEYTNFSFY